MICLCLIDRQTKINKMNFTVTPSSCCVCLAETVDKVSSCLFKTYYDEIQYSSIYEFCTSFAVKSGNAVSLTRICHDCENCLIQLYEFRRTCETSENILEYINKIIKDKLKSITINVENCEEGEDVYSIDSYIISETTDIESSDDMEFKITPLEDMYDVLMDDIPVNITTKSVSSGKIDPNIVKVEELLNETEEIQIKPTIIVKKIITPVRLDSAVRSESKIDVKLDDFPYNKIANRSNYSDLKDKKEISSRVSNSNELRANSKTQSETISLPVFDKHNTRSTNGKGKSENKILILEDDKDDAETSEMEVKSENNSIIDEQTPEKMLVSKTVKKRKKFDINKIRKVQCEKCGKVLPIKYRKIHMQTHEEKQPEEVERKYICQICGKRYKYSDALSKHKRVHNNDKRYECPYCDMKFMIWSTRRRHVDKEHTGFSRFDCHLCDKKFFNSSGRISHIRNNHSNEREFGCEICEKRFTHAYKLKMHMNIHANLRNFVCELCDRGFFNSKGLRLHKLMHTGEKNFKCPVCNKGFTISYLLRQHIQKSHPHFELPPLGTSLTPELLDELNGTKEIIHFQIETEN